MAYYVVVDLEMCKVPKYNKPGYGHNHEIIQIGAALMDDKLDIIDKYNTFVKPDYGVLDDFISKLTGIKPEDLKDAPMVAEAVEDFLGWLPDGEVTAISWSFADRNQFHHELTSKGIEISDRFNHILENWVDCQPQFSEKMNMKKRYSLEEALVAADICTDGHAHNGMVDAYNTALLYAKMQREEKLVLNKYYKTAHEDSEPEHLSFSFGDLLDKLT